MTDTQPTLVTAGLLEELADRTSEEPLVSMYFPTSSRPDELRKNEVRLKNALREAREQLRALGAEESAIRDILRPVSGLAGDDCFRAHRSKGVALLTGDGERWVCPLPVEPGETVLVATRFHVKPLITAAALDGAYFVLALSKNEVRLFRGNGMTLDAVETHAEVPTSLADVVGRELSEKQLQHHAGDAGSESAIFHGHGSGKDDSDPEVRRFVDVADKALREHHLDGTPLILAGVNELTALYRRVSDYERILDATVAGNVEHESEADLHEKAWPLFRKHQYAACERLLERLANEEKSATAIRRLDDIVIAANDGRIAELVVASDREHWGRFDVAGRRTSTHDERRPGDTDLLDYAASAGLRTGADVVTMPAERLPSGITAIASLRY